MCLARCHPRMLLAGIHKLESARHQSVGGSASGEDSRFSANNRTDPPVSGGRGNDMLNKYGPAGPPL